jgi:hypothetical protein
MGVVISKALRVPNLGKDAIDITSLLMETLISISKLGWHAI